MSSTSAGSSITGTASARMRAASYSPWATMARTRWPLVIQRPMSTISAVKSAGLNVSWRNRQLGAMLRASRAVSSSSGPMTTLFSRS